MAGINQVTHHKSLSTEKLSLTIPEKSKGRYVSYLSQRGSSPKIAAPLYVQTPVLTLSKVSEESLEFTTGSANPFVDNLHKLDGFVLDTVAKRTVEFFSGKRFSREWIASRYESRVQNATTGSASSAVTLNLSLPPQTKDLLIKDQRGADRTLADLKPGMKCISVVHFPGVSFTKASIRADFVTVQMKVYIEDTIPWSILDNDSEEDVTDRYAPEEDEATIDDDEVDAEVSALRLATLDIKAPHECDSSFVPNDPEKNDDGADLF